MKYLICLISLFIVCSINLGQCKTLNDYIEEANNYQSANQLEEAIETMEQAVKEHPDSSAAYTHLGIVLSSKAQGINDFSEIGVAIKKVFEMWGKALELDPHNVTARFYRGAWAVNIPKFMGQLKTGIKDLEIIVSALAQSSDVEARAQLTEAYSYLASGYQKNGEYEQAKETWNELINIAPETEFAEEARTAIGHIVMVEKWLAEKQDEKEDAPEITTLKQELEKDPDNIHLLMTLSRSLVDNERYEEAYDLLNRVIVLDQSNVNAYKMLAASLEHIVGEGYDPRIYLDTDFRTDLAFKVMLIMDRIIELSPDDLEMRFNRGIIAVEMPFFVGKLDQGIEDLEIVIKSNAPETTRAEAHYWLGMAYRKKAMTQWIRVVSDYPNTDAVQLVFGNLNPGVKHLDISQYKQPIVVIDFILGFQDELAPQTVVWVEDKEGHFIKTVYVSGFSGHAKKKQINLPIWAGSSKFIDVDAITGASIDLGHHIYVWDLQDYLGKKVKSGDYIIKVEVKFWPSMQYQLVAAHLKVGKKDSRVVIKKGNLIPYLEVKYLKNP